MFYIIFGQNKLIKGWDGPWTGENYINDDYPIISKDLNELNRDPRLTFIDIKGHGYTEKAVKQCGMRYMGPMFYENWGNRRDLNDDGTCASPDVNHALNVADRNVRFWYLGGSSVLGDIKPGVDKYQKWNFFKTNEQAHHTCYEATHAANTLNLPYCFSRFSRRLYDSGAGDL